MLTDQLKSFNVDLTQGRVMMVQDSTPINIRETAEYFNSTGLLIDEAYILERPLDGGKGFAISCDPNRMKKEGFRWRLSKNSTPLF